MVSSKTKFITLILLSFFLLSPVVHAATKPVSCVGKGRSKVSVLVQVTGVPSNKISLIKPVISISSRLSKKRSCASKVSLKVNKAKTIRYIPHNATVKVNAKLCRSSFSTRARSTTRTHRAKLICTIPAEAPTPVATTTPLPFSYDEFTQPSKLTMQDGITILDILPETYANAESAAVYPAIFKSLAEEAFLRQTQDEASLRGTPEITRARRLQGALDFANLVAKTSPNTKVRVITPPAIYNLLSLKTQPGRNGFTTVSTKDAPYLPRLYIAPLAEKSSIEILSPWAAYPDVYKNSPTTNQTRPLLTYNDPLCDSKDTCRARILLLISPNQTVRVDGLGFEGDHEHNYRAKYEYYTHENPQRQTTLGLGRIALIMVGTLSSASAAKVVDNKVLLNDLVLSKINYRGIQIFGNATVTNSHIQGIIQLPRSTARFSQSAIYTSRVNWVEGVRGGITPYLHASDNPGQAWNVGIYADSQFSPKSTIIEHNEFTNLLQGVVSLALGEQSSVSYNKFEYILDHALYSLVAIQKGSKVSYNHIIRTVGFALKFAGHSNATDTTSLAGVNGTEIIGNYFFHTKDGLIALAGSDNYIAHNRYDPYEPAMDETGGWFDPINDAIPGNSLNPKIMISTFGGNYSCVTIQNSSITKQPGFANTTRNNILENNSASAGSSNRPARYQLDKMTIFIDQAQGTSSALYSPYLKSKYADRSIDGNIVLLASTPDTKAYFRKRTQSNFPAGISTDDTTKLFYGIPPNCKGCEYTTNSATQAEFEANPCLPVS